VYHSIFIKFTSQIYYKKSNLYQIWRQSSTKYIQTATNVQKNATKNKEEQSVD